MRTFVNGPVFMLAVGVLALVPGPAHAGAPQPGRTRDLGAAR
ncbi:hypothetical protein [Streptomyces azureus]|nr:hypothetical protein [Streptomyces azureus]